MRRPAYIAVLLALLVLLCWPRPIAPPAETEPASATSPNAADSDVAGVSTPTPDRPADVGEFLQAPWPSTLPPPSDQGLLRDLEEAVDEIRNADNIARDPIEIRPELAPLLPPVAEETEPEPDPDP